MKAALTNIALCAALLAVAACEPGMGALESNILQYWRRDGVATATPEEKKKLEYRLMQENPEKLAEEAARDHDYRLISQASGYHATDKDAKIFGVKCAAETESIPFVTGCVPPPPFYYRFILRYNTALLKQSGFPAASACVVDNEIVKEVEGYSKKFEEEAAASTEKSRKKWEERNKASKIYNP